MDGPSLKLVTLKPRKAVPVGAMPLADAIEKTGADSLMLARIAEQPPAIPDELIQRIDRLEQLVLGFRKELTDFGSGLDFTEARLNRCIRLAKTLAGLAGVPE